MDLKNCIKNLNSEIRSHFYSEKRSNVRRNLRPGDSKSLWKAVNAVKGIGTKLFNKSIDTFKLYCKKRILVHVNLLDIAGTVNLRGSSSMLYKTN